LDHGGNNYGDFRGDPEKLMERYFDAFCYLANWGTRRLMFRFPHAFLDAEAASRYRHTDVASVIATDEHVNGSAARRGNAGPPPRRQRTPSVSTTSRQRERAPGTRSMT
jgi:hypothetical protein